MMQSRQTRRKASASSSSSSFDVMSGPTYEELVNGASENTSSSSSVLDENERSQKFDIAIDENMADSNIMNKSSISTISKSTAGRSKSPVRSPLAGLSRNDASLQSRGKTPPSTKSTPSKLLVFASPSPRIRRSRRQRDRTSEDGSENAFVTRRRIGAARGGRTEEENMDGIFGDDMSLSVGQKSNDFTSAVLDICDGRSEDMDVDMSSSSSESVRNEEKYGDSSRQRQYGNSSQDLSSSRNLTMATTATKTYYPDDVRVPGPDVLKRFYNNAIANSKKEGGTESHQRYLDEMGSGLLSLEEVIIPSIMHEENEALKRLQAIAQRDINETADGKLRVQAIELSRRAVKKCAFAAIDAARESRLKREEEEKREEEIRRIARREAKQKAKDRRRQEKEKERQRQRKERAQARARERERVRKEKKKNLPKNKKLWREVALLMTDLARLQKEEKMWMEAKSALNDREKEMKEAKKKLDLEMRKSNIDEEKDGAQAVDSINKITDEKQMQADVTHLVEDITLAANRINQTLKTTTDLMEKSDQIRMEMTKRYRDDHMFHGYRGVNDPKSLVQSIAQD